MRASSSPPFAEPWPATDRDAFRRAAHSLKSTSESLGAFGLATLARELETIGQAGRLHEVGDRIERLAAQYELVTRALGSSAMASPANAPSGRLLVVDDNRVNRLLLGRALEQLGHTVDVRRERARGAGGAAEDVPSISSSWTSRCPRWTAIRCWPPWPPTRSSASIPVVMMSSVEEVDSVARCIEMGAEDYLFKPVNPVLLRARVGASLEKKRLRDRQRELFRQFATAEVAEELLKTGLTLGGKHVEASVMFSDIRAFTSLTEARSPVETIELLNSYYTLMFDAIGGHGGIVNQMLGDGLMAIFGAPLPHADHRERAVRAALDMLELVEGFNREQSAPGPAGDPDRHRHRRGAAGRRLHGDAAARDLHLRGRDA